MPDISVSDSEKKLVKDIDYVISYLNNINVGTAYLIITGKGNYAGEKKVAFAIVKDESDKKVGEKVVIKNNTYTITADQSGKSVEFTSTNSTSTKMVIPEKVSIGEKTYTVTSIATKAFANKKKLRSVTIPKSVKSIGKEAFKNANKLKTVTIKGTKIKTIGKNAFKGIHKKATIKIPKSKKKAYKKLLKKSGYKGKVK